MAKKLSLVVLVLGAFALVLGALSKFYMYDRLAVVPLNQQTTSISQTAPGDDATYLDIAGGLVERQAALKSVRTVTGNVEASEEASDELGEDIAVWDTYVCTAPQDFDCSSGTPLSGSLERIAFDRHTGETVDWSGNYSEIGGERENAAVFDGLFFKFPFGTEKKDYQFWDGTLRKATTAEYQGEEEIDGLKVYAFEQTIAPSKSGEIDVPGSLVDSDEDSVTADRMYSNTRTFKVEPVTGVIIVGGESQDSWLEYEGVRGATTTKATLQYTDENTQATVDDYKPKAQLLSIVKTTLPVGGLIAGIVLIGLGLVLRRRSGDHTA